MHILLYFDYLHLKNKNLKTTDHFKKSSDDTAGSKYDFIIYFV